MTSHSDADHDPEVLFHQEDGEATSPAQAPPWKVLVVDDDDEVHRATDYGLQGVRILDRPLELLHAYSGAEALELLQRERGVAVVLLDVVMETISAGLDIVGTIREDLALTDARIILRTGQPGYAPDEQTVTRFDINDYRTKSELTRSKLFVALFTAIRAFDQLQRGSEQQRFLHETLRLSSSLIEKSGVDAYAAALIDELQGPFEADLSGFVALCSNQVEQAGEARVLVAGEGFRHGLGGPLAQLASPALMAQVRGCILSHSICVEPDAVTVWVALDKQQGLLVHARSTNPLVPAQLQLLQVLHRHLDLSASKVYLTEKLHGQAFFDAMVGLPNRSALIDAIDARREEASTREWVVGIVDIDRFAEINDMFGHALGDRLLRAFARRLAERMGDTVFVARIGADVFGFLVPADMLDTASLRGLCQDPIVLDGEAHRLTVSVGLALSGDAQASGEELVKNASLALKRAKAQGTGQLAWYTREVELETRERMRLLQAFTEAPSLGQLYLAFQPQWSLASGELVGFEALMRWRTADGRHVPPDTFIPIAENSGLIVDTGRWVLETALQAAQSIRLAGLPAARMAVNISAIQVQQPGFLEMIDAVLASSGLPAAALELEITESVVMKGSDAVEAIFGALRSRGIALAIDDFGTGYSSLSYLHRLPVDRVKIDRAFVRELESGGRGARVAAMVIPMGRQLGMKVIAEGIETRAQARILTELGCDEGQGYLLAKPMPLSELLEWLPLRPGLEQLR